MCCIQTNVLWSNVFISDVVELRRVIGEELVLELVESSSEESDRLAVRSCFTALMTCPDDVIQKQLNILHERLKRDCW